MTQDTEFTAAGARLRELRLNKNMSQEDVAFAAGVDQSTYSKMERLGPQVVSWSKAQAVAKALGCTITIEFKKEAAS